MNGIRRLFGDKEAVAARRAYLDNPDRGHYGSMDYQRINKVTGGMLNDPNKGAYDLAADGVQMFDASTHSTKVIIAQCAPRLPSAPRAQVKKQESCS